MCLQADGTHKTNLHRMPALIIGKVNFILILTIIFRSLFLAVKQLFFSYLPLIVVGSSDRSRTFHVLAVALSTHEDSEMFEFIGNRN